MMQNVATQTLTDCQLSDLDLENLRHMVGYGGKQRGYRNRFCAAISQGDKDYLSMLRLVELGLAVSGRQINTRTSQFFHATEAGCKAAGLTPKETDYALDRA